MKIGVVGAGAWGTALANLLADKGLQVDLWAFEAEVCADIVKHGENRLFLPGIPLSENLRPSNDLGEAVSEKEILLLVMPSHVFRSVSENLAGYLAEKTVIVSASKGIENKTKGGAEDEEGLVIGGMSGIGAGHSRLDWLHPGQYRPRRDTRNKYKWPAARDLGYRAG